MTITSVKTEGGINSRTRAPGIFRSWLAFLMTVLAAAPLGAQVDPPPMPDHQFAKVGNIRLEYFQFGDSGTPVIVIQDHHDYFHDRAGPDAFSPEWLDFLRELGTTYTLVAPVRRGWGESDDPGYGYDVATQAEDVLGLMDALEIRRAVLFGRTAATQEMTWIAEHHPERVIALAYLGTPIGHLQDRDPGPDVSRFDQMYSRTSCDIGDGSEVDARLTPRDAWRPHFSGDRDRRIELPALLILHPVFDRVSMDVRRIDRVRAWEPDDFGDPDSWCDDEAKAYFTELSRDTARLNALRRTFVERNELARTQNAMRRAFGDHLTIVWEEVPSQEPGPDDLIRILREYVDGLQYAH